MAEIDYLAWADQYRDQATQINKKIEELRREQSQAHTVEKKHELAIKIIKYEEIHYDLITAYQSLKEKGDNLHKENG